MKTSYGHYRLVRASRAAGLLAAWLISACAYSNEAEIVLLVGQGEKRVGEAAQWSAAAVTQRVPAGGYVRTQQSSQMGLLLADRTQIRLNQNSLMQVKTIADAQEWKETTVKLQTGRAWSQARPATGPQDGARQAAKISMETPSATLSIRGTDWEVEVRPDGGTQLAVVSGTVEIGNDFGRLTVLRGEAAIAEPGKAPVKTSVVNPRQRVQWVSAWRLQPERWGGADKDAGIRRQADQMTFDGRITEAAALLEPAVRGAAPEALSVALLARILALDDRIAEALQLLSAVPATVSAHPEVKLAQGDLAILDSNPALARASFQAVLADGNAGKSQRALAAVGLAIIEDERGNLKKSLDYLARAEGELPGKPVALAEKGMALVAAGKLGEGEALLAEVLAGEPDNFVARTALGLSYLKRGQSDDALREFMKAGTIEPRYARAWLYSAVAFYQQGERERAMQALEKTKSLDPKDPLPYMLESMVRYDDLDYTGSIRAAREARDRLPFLKSLDQLANDQKGNANLGSALAAFGLEDWASFYAAQSATPYWAGSHFFRADRYTGEFDKSSSLYLGFLTDPLAFGTSNRQSSLLQAPGHYGQIELYGETFQWRQQSLIGTVNGLAGTDHPFAYFLSGNVSGADSIEDKSSALGKQVVVGLGFKPRYDLGVFLYGNRFVIDADLASQSLTDDRMDLHDQRIDLGLNYKISQKNQIWLKLGQGDQGTDVSGAYYSPEIAGALNRALGSSLVQPEGRLDGYRTSADQRDLQLRHSWDARNTSFSWGVEVARQHRPGTWAATFSPLRLLFDEDQRDRTSDAYLAAKWGALQPIQVQAEIWRQRGKIKRSDLVQLDLVPTPGIDFTQEALSAEQSYADWNPRLGLAFDLGGQGWLKLVHQHWRRPASLGTISDIDTLGVALNDQLPMVGGDYRRNRLQFDRLAGSRLFYSLYLDHEKVDNGLKGQLEVVPELDLAALDALRQRRNVFSPLKDIEETPHFDSGRVHTLGMAVNFLFADSHSGYAKYLYRDSEQTGSNSGAMIPYLPRHMLRLGSNWQLPKRWLLGAHATYRSERFRDAQNLESIHEGWSLGGTAYWETDDKKLSVQFLLDNVLSRNSAGVDKRPFASLRVVQRF